MKIPFVIQQRYSESIKIFEALKQKVYPVIVAYCDQNNFAFSQRMKSLDSVTEKIETGRFKSFDDIDDIWAVSVIVPTLKFENSVIDFIKSKFTVENIKKRGAAKKSPDVFRFDSTRISCKYNDITNQKPIFIDSLFEVQVKSAFEHAWTVATHEFNYKSDVVDWRISRLASQMKASVEQLDTIAISYNDIYKHIEQSNWPINDSKKLIFSYIKEIESNIPKEMLPSNLTRFCENISSLIEKINKHSIIDNTEKAIQIFRSYFIQNNFVNIPRSISLFQFFICVLIDNGFFNNNNLKLPILITGEMESIFPKLKNISTQHRIVI